MKNTPLASPSTPAVFTCQRRPAIFAAALACALGLATGLSPHASAQNLITNGGFETGNFSGWQLVPGPDRFTAVFTTPLGSPFVHSGTHAAEFGALNRQFAGIEQAISTPGQPFLKGKYQVSFWVRNGGGIPSRFQAVWNGKVIYDTVNAKTSLYQQSSFKELGSDGKFSTLLFQGYNTPSFNDLDDVSVTQTGYQAFFSQYADEQNFTPNQKAVAGGLDRAINHGKAQSLANYFATVRAGDVPGDFDRISPSDLTSIFTIATALAQEQSMNIQRRNDDIRSGSSGFSAAGLAVNTFGPSYNGGFGVAGPSGDDGKEVKESKEVKQVVPAENRWGTFLSGTGEWISVGDTNNARGYDLASGGFTLGIDYKVTPNFAIGLMAGYTGTTADLTDHGRVWVNGGSLGVYATFFQNQAQPGPTMSKDSSKEAPAPAPSIAKGFYADIAASGGYNSYDTRRSALLGDARGSTDGGDINALFGVGYDFKAAGLTFGPTGTFNYTYTGTNGFNETGSLAPLNVHGGEGESLRSAFGLKASYDWKVGGILIKPELRAAWQHEYGDTSYALDSSFDNGASGTFTVNGPKLGRDSVLLGAGFAIQCSERWFTYFYYDGELGRQNYESNAVTGGVRLSF